MKAVTAAAYADIRGRSKGWVSEQIRLGMPAKGKGRSGSNFEIDAAKAFEWELERARKRAEDAPESHQQRVQAAQAEKLELGNQQRRRELALVTYIEGVFQGMAADLAGRLDSLSGRLANELSGLEPAAVRERIRAETDEIRAGVADYFGKLAESAPLVADAGEAVESPAEPDGERVGGRKPNPSGRKRRAGKVQK